MTRVIALALVVLVSAASTGRAWCEAACAAPRAQASDPQAHCSPGATMAGSAAFSSPDAPAMTSDAACDMRTTVWPPAFRGNTTTLVAAATAAAVLVPVAPYVPSEARTAETAGSPSPPSARRSIPLRI